MSSLKVFKFIVLRGSCYSGAEHFMATAGFSNPNRWQMNTNFERATGLFYVRVCCIGGVMILFSNPHNILNSLFFRFIGGKWTGRQTYLSQDVHALLV